MHVNRLCFEDFLLQGWQSQFHPELCILCPQVKALSIHSNTVLLRPTQLPPLPFGSKRKISLA
jgi:hypothetical protein